MSVLTSRMDALFSKWDSTDSPGCVLAVIKDGEFIYTHGYGMADLERDIPITEDSIFDIGSTGKQFTATVIAILANKELLGLDDSIRKHLPEMPSYADPITIRHLVHHTSGLRDYLTLMDLHGLFFENIYTEDFLFDLIVSQKGLNFEPGSQYLYSNSGYFLLGVIAKRVTGKDITELIREHILDPLGMKHTTFNKDYRPIVKNRAMSYDAEEDTFINALALSGGFGDGALLTNIKDLLFWDRNFYNNKLNHAQPDLIEQLHRTSKLNEGKPINYAFGLVVTAYKGQRMVQHAGGWAGYRTEMMRFPDQHFSVICISNLGSIDPTMLCQQVADIYLEDMFTAHRVKKNRAPKSQVISNTAMKEFTGIYQGKRSTVEISIKADMLYFLDGIHDFPLRTIGNRKFQLEGRPVFLSFTGKQNELLKIREDGKQDSRLKRVRSERFTPTDLSSYTGDYFSPEIGIRYNISIQDNSLQLKRTPFDKPKPLLSLTENTLSCDLGEMRLQYKNGSVKGFALNAERVTNIKFRKAAKAHKQGETFV